MDKKLLETATLYVELMNGKRQVQIRVCRLTKT